MEDINIVNEGGGKADSYLITISLALIATFAIFWTNQATISSLTYYVLVVSFVSLTLASFGLIWNKIRRPIRQIIFEKNKKKAIEEHAGKIADFVENVAIPFAKIQVARNAINKKKDEEVNRLYRYTVESFVKNIQFDLDKLYEKTFEKPLEEDYALLRFYIDTFSHRTRYHFFIVGALGFFLSVLLSFNK